MRFLGLVFLFALTGCASGATYQLLAGGRYERYTEKEKTPIDTQLANALGGTFTTTQGDPSKITISGEGGQVGFYEKKGRLTSSLSAFYQKFAAYNYSFNSSLYQTINDKIEANGWGLQSSLGYDVLPFLRPELALFYENDKLTNTVSGTFIGTGSSTSDTRKYYGVGGGVAIELPLTHAVHLVADGHYYVALSAPSGTTSANTAVVQVNLRIGSFGSGAR